MYEELRVQTFVTDRMKTIDWLMILIDLSRDVWNFLYFKLTKELIKDVF